MLLNLDPRYIPYFEKLNSKGLPLYSGISYSGCPLIDTTISLCQLPDVLITGVSINEHFNTVSINGYFCPVLIHFLVSITRQKCSSANPFVSIGRVLYTRYHCNCFKLQR